MSPRRVPETADYLTPEDVAVLLHLSVRTVKRHLASGALPGRKLGGVWRIRREDLDRAMAAGPPQAPPPQPTKRPRGRR